MGFSFQNGIGSDLKTPEVDVRHLYGARLGAGNTESLNVASQQMIKINDVGGIYTCARGSRMLSIEDFNQDGAILDPRFIAVADGIGGGLNGTLAADIALSVFKSAMTGTNQQVRHALDAETWIGDAAQNMKDAFPELSHCDGSTFAYCSVLGRNEQMVEVEAGSLGDARVLILGPDGELLYASPSMNLLDVLVNPTCDVHASVALLSYCGSNLPMHVCPVASLSHYNFFDGDHMKKKIELIVNNCKLSESDHIKLRNWILQQCFSRHQQNVDQVSEARVLLTTERSSHFQYKVLSYVAPDTAYAYVVKKKLLVPSGSRAFLFTDGLEKEIQQCDLSGYIERGGVDSLFDSLNNRRKLNSSNPVDDVTFGWLQIK